MVVVEVVIFGETFVVIIVLAVVFVVTTVVVVLAAVVLAGEEKLLGVKTAVLYVIVPKSPSVVVNCSSKICSPSFFLESLRR